MKRTTLTLLAAMSTTVVLAACSDENTGGGDGGNAKADEDPKAYVCVYPFVRSYEWYVMDDEERRAMLAEHGQMGRGYPDVRANTVASFALGDYEWILAFEADELYRIVDLMRHLRASKARLHVREEIPFYTGRRKPLSEIVADLP